MLSIMGRPLGGPAGHSGVLVSAVSKDSTPSDGLEASVQAVEADVAVRPGCRLRRHAGGSGA